MSKIFSISIAILLLVSGVVLAEDGEGGYAGAFLRIPMGARPVAMGGAYTAIANDGAGSFYNVAGITGINQP